MRQASARTQLSTVGSRWLTGTTRRLQIVLRPPCALKRWVIRQTNSGSALRYQFPAIRGPPWLYCLCVPCALGDLRHLRSSTASPVTVVYARGTHCALPALHPTHAPASARALHRSPRKKVGRTRYEIPTCSPCSFPWRGPCVTGPTGGHWGTLLRLLDPQPACTGYQPVIARLQRQGGGRVGEGPKFRWVQRQPCRKFDPARLRLALTAPYAVVTVPHTRVQHFSYEHAIRVDGSKSEMGALHVMSLAPYLPPWAGHRRAGGARPIPPRPRYLG